jgi:hypothetical protein
MNCEACGKDDLTNVITSVAEIIRCEHCGHEIVELHTKVYS